MLVWDVGSKFLDDRPRSGKGLFGFFPAPLVLIEPAQGNGNAPERRAQPLRPRSFLRGSQHSFGFHHPVEYGQRLTAQFPEAGDDTLVGQIGGRRDQP